MTNLKPAPGYILVEPQKKETTTASGIVLSSDSQSEKSSTGKVIALGSTYTSDYGTKKEAPCKVGDSILFKEWGGTEHKQDDKTYLFVKFDDIIALLN